VTSLLTDEQPVSTGDARQRPPSSHCLNAKSAVQGRNRPDRGQKRDVQAKSDRSQEQKNPSFQGVKSHVFSAFFC
jgi:hypothetical protein